MSLDEEDIFVIRWIRVRMKKQATTRKYKVNPCCNESCEAGSFVAATELAQVRERCRSFYRQAQKNFKLLTDILGDEILRNLLCVFKVSAYADGLHTTEDVRIVAGSET
jgi:hypothetical protein